ncbi:hypothetical protein CLV43_12731 [Umezawaea tangerina]|uniref:Uncharacterized protein n=1 Tax=Umezawaea tangerina TaxID=84725 RepID=A0A2T0S5I6_9PSEU|nr:hypothetical protein CLV43_12731 [Umezawaea tangerina]
MVFRRGAWGKGGFRGHQAAPDRASSASPSDQASLLRGGQGGRALRAGWGWRAAPGGGTLGFAVGQGIVAALSDKAVGRSAPDARWRAGVGTVGFAVGQGILAARRTKRRALRAGGEVAGCALSGILGFAVGQSILASRRTRPQALRAGCALAGCAQRGDPRLRRRAGHPRCASDRASELRRTKRVGALCCGWGGGAPRQWVAGAGPGVRGWWWLGRGGLGSSRGCLGRGWCRWLLRRCSCVGGSPRACARWRCGPR